MIGKKRLPSQPSTPTDNNGRALVGVRLMNEPGFAAHDSHLYRRGPSGGETALPVARLPTGELVAVGSRDDRGSSPPRSSAQTRSDPYPPRERPSTRDPVHRRRRGGRIPPSRTGPFDGVGLGTDFSHALARLPTPAPQALLKALSARDPVTPVGKVHVSLRVSPTIPLQTDETSIISLDKKRRQVTILEPQTAHTQERVGVSAPKMFAFDQVYSQDDRQSIVASRVLPDILQAVLGGTDGCVLCFGGTGVGKTHTMVGSHGGEGELGLMPTALSWLYQAVAHLKARKAARFSVRASALVVDAPGKHIADVLGDFAQDSETSPGALLRQGSSAPGALASAAEVRAPSPEVAARYLDVALSARGALAAGTSRATSGPTTLLFTLHVYQYTVDKSHRGKVLGGRSRLHLVDLGDLSGAHSDGLSLSGLTSVLLAIFNGHKYLPHKFNRLTQLLQEVLGSVTCHAAIVVHASPAPRHARHTLATLQLASRVHRLRRKKIRGVSSGGSSSSGASETPSSQQRSSGSSSTSAGSSSIDFSSSEQSADTVIYIGGAGGDSSDGEHPPIFLPHHIRRHRSVELPRLRSFEQLRPHTASPGPPVPVRRPISVSPTPTSRSAPPDKGGRTGPPPPPRLSSARSLTSTGTSGVAGPLQFFRHQPGVRHVIYPSSKGAREDQVPLEEEKRAGYRFYQQPNNMVPVFPAGPQGSGTLQGCPSSQAPSQRTQDVFSHVLCRGGAPSLHSRRSCSDDRLGPSQAPPPSDEHWIDGPRVSRSRVQGAKNKLPETWVDGPSTEKGPQTGPGGSYGFMDDHKKTMIERWVETQTAQVVTGTNEAPSAPSHTQADSRSPDHLRRASSSEREVPSMLPGPSTGVEEDLNLGSDVDTLSEDQSGALFPGDPPRPPDLIEELERKQLIPVLERCPEIGPSEKAALSKDGIGAPEDGRGTREEDVCSQCEDVDEELHSLLSCEEDECKRQAPNGLATVVEEPELESAFGADDPVDDAVSLLNNPHTDCEDTLGAPSDVDLEPRLAPRRPHPNSSSALALRKVVDAAVQVCEEDIIRLLSTTPCPSDLTTDTSGDDHPLRVLSEENLTCASTFTDSCSQIGETGDEASDEEDEADHTTPFSLLEAVDYGKICAALRAEAPGGDLAEIHRLFSVFTRHPPAPPEPKVGPVLQVPSSPLWDAGVSSNPYHPRLPPQATPIQKKEGWNSPPPARPPLHRGVNDPSGRRSLDKCTGTDDGNVEARGDPTSLRGPHDAFLSTALSLTTKEVPVSFGLVGAMPSQPPELDSDCPSSEDSEYQSRFSKFLCVGRTKSSKGAAKPAHPKPKGGEARRVLFKLRCGDAKTKALKGREIPSPPEAPPKTGSPSRAQLEPTHAIPTPVDETLPKPSLDHDIKCLCRNLGPQSSPQGGQYPSRHDFYSGPTPNSSKKEWSLAPISLVSPQLCTDPPPAGGSSKVGCSQATHPMTTSGSLGTTQSLGESSGYESIPRDSECSSFSSSQESEIDEEHRKFLSQGHVKRSAAASGGAVAPSGGVADPPEVSRVEAIVQNSFLKHLTKRTSAKTEAKLVSSTTWKYRCW